MSLHTTFHAEFLDQKAVALPVSKIPPQSEINLSEEKMQAITTLDTDSHHPCLVIQTLASSILQTESSDAAWLGFRGHPDRQAKVALERLQFANSLDKSNCGACPF
ncbi:hypothetical protein CLAIMM_14500 [Cladophialophora immunda]|nr:hypothetical protein CLAIMM_14500 [Cladophialophora immunda]